MVWRAAQAGLASTSNSFALSLNGTLEVAVDVSWQLIGPGAGVLFGMLVALVLFTSSVCLLSSCHSLTSLVHLSF